MSFIYVLAFYVIAFLYMVHVKVTYTKNVHCGPMIVGTDGLKSLKSHAVESHSLIIATSLN